MDLLYEDYIISDNKALIQVDRVYKLLKTTYWAAKWITEEITTQAVENSFCFGIYKDGTLVGFALCVTDYSTMYYLTDVVIDENHRGLGLGKFLTKFVTEHKLFSHLLGVIETKDAHRLYEKFGFKTSKGFAMRKDPW